MKAIQLLPINDTTRTGSWHDSYPYNGISVFALHPAYLDLREWRGSKAYKVYSALGTELNALPEVDYERAFKLKWTLHTLYIKRVVQRWWPLRLSRSFAMTMHIGCLPTLLLHAARHLPHGRFSLMARRCAQSRRTGGLHCQAPRCGRQPPVLRLAAIFAAPANATGPQHGTRTGGDTEGGYSHRHQPRQCAGMGRRPFVPFDGQAGAPPDDFAVHGQNWGFPTYNWEVMAQDGYQWWRSRLKHMEQYFDAYRIDHVLGFSAFGRCRRNIFTDCWGSSAPPCPIPRPKFTTLVLGATCKPCVCHV